MNLRILDVNRSYGPNEKVMTIPACLTAVKANPAKGVYALELSQHSNGTGTDGVTNEIARSRTIFEIDMDKKEVQKLMDGLSQALKASTTPNN